MRIQHNIPAMSAYRNYTNNVSAMKKNLEKLSSGYKINRAGDDAAGLAISEKMRAQITGLETAQKNAKDGISLVQTAEGALTEVHDMLNRMVTLATQSANGTYDNETDRFQLQKELDQLRSEINRIADSSNFNGIKLLDGSLDANSATAAASSISNITTNDFISAGVSDAFKSNYITNRPEAATKQTNAEFVLKIDDAALSAASAGNTEIELKVGDATIKASITDKAAKTTEDIVDALITGGCAGAGTDVANGATTGDTADKWTTTTNTGAAGGGAYIKIDGNIYKMTKEGTNSIKFSQVNFMGNTGEVVNPDFQVSLKATSVATDANFTGTVNWQPQLTVQGEGVGSSHQAQVDVEIDFSKLRDGDQLTVGDKTYVFKIGANSTTKATDAAANGVLVDLSNIFKTESDMADADKQAEAMVKITKDMGAGTSTLWSIGNGGATDGKGTLTFQSLSSYTDGTTAISGQPATADKAKMDTEANVMAQFFSTTKGTPASVSFELDVTKIKEGDTFIVDGITFEFTDGTHTSAKENIAIDLSSYGIANENGIASSFTAKIADDIKNKIDANVVAGGAAKYTTTIDGNKITLASKDIAATAAVNEAKTAAKIELPGVVLGKPLTLQIGDTAEDFNQLKVSIGDCHTAAIGIEDISIADQESAAKAVDAIKSAINYVSDVRGTLGATQNRLDHTINNLSVMTENIQDAESTIRDTDVAAEMMEYTKNNILIQSAQAMLAQANQMPQGVLQLLQ